MLWRWREVDCLASYKKPSWPPILVASLFAEPFAVILSGAVRATSQLMAVHMIFFSVVSRRSMPIAALPVRQGVLQQISIKTADMSFDRNCLPRFPTIGSSCVFCALLPLPIHKLQPCRNGVVPQQGQQKTVREDMCRKDCGTSAALIIRFL